MRSTFNFTEGLEEYIKDLQKAEKEINPICRQALAEIGVRIQSDMRARVPVKSGNLSDHIKIKTPTGEGDFNYVEVGIIYDLAFTDKKTSIQARAIEFGSVHAAAQPFVRPAVRANKAYAIDLIRDRLKAAALVD